MNQIFTIFFSFSKLLVVVLGPVSVEELVSVEDAFSARFARYGIKINIELYGQSYNEGALFFSTKGFIAKEKLQNRYF